MDRYKKYQAIASICVTVFILSLALCITALDRKVYGYSARKYIQLGTLSTFEAELVYDQIADDFCSFFKKGYDVAGYELGESNIKALNELKVFYRWAWILAVLSFAGMIYSFVILSKRRYYMPFVYGGVGAMLVSACGACIIFASSGGILSEIKAMILHMDYSLFAEGDVIYGLFPPEYARYVGLAYLVTVIMLMVLMILIRFLIVYCGRPHKF